MLGSAMGSACIQPQQHGDALDGDIGTIQELFTYVEHQICF